MLSEQLFGRCLCSVARTCILSQLPLQVLLMVLRSILALLLLLSPQPVQQKQQCLLRPELLLLLLVHQLLCWSQCQLWLHHMNV